MENRIDRILILPLKGAGFKEQFINCREQISQYTDQTGSRIIQQSYFIDAPDNESYLKMYGIINEEIRKQGYPLPSTSIIAQSPASGHKISVELIMISRLSPDMKLSYETEQGVPYTKLSGSLNIEIYAGGISAYRPFDPFIDQVEKGYQLLEAILRREELEFSDIVRQWNYVEEILSVHDVGEEHIQNYQVLNDIRSLFYSKSSFVKGYPAATGIGMNSGGLVLEVYAVHPSVPMDIIPIKNPLQVDAYHYSENVLVGDSVAVNHRKTTPKFERAKYAGVNGKGTIFISGTASIQNEKTLGENDITIQSEITIKNISNLILSENLERAGLFSLQTPPRYSFIRVYIRNREDVGTVKKICDAFYGDIPVHYLIADVCRNNLLLEIEGVAEIG
jgi:hypothetical protein